MHTTFSKIQQSLMAAAIIAAGAAVSEAGDINVQFHVNPPPIIVRPQARPRPTPARCTRCRQVRCVCHRRQRRRPAVEPCVRRPPVVVVRPPVRRPPVVVVRPPVRRPSVVVVRRPIVKETPGQRAWRYLNEGWSRSAHREFAAIVRRHPRRARVQLGYAVAAYRIDHPGEAVLALRLAFALDPEVLRNFQCSRIIRRDLREIRAAARSVASRRVRRRHGFFTIAATSYVLGDIREARKYAALAVRHGDRKTATIKLARVLHVRGI